MDEFADELVRIKSEIVKFMELLDFMDTGISQIDDAIDSVYSTCDEAISEFDTVIELMNNDDEK